jgi:hypothetical protein
MEAAAPAGAAPAASSPPPVPPPGVESYQPLLEVTHKFGGDLTLASFTDAAPETVWHSPFTALNAAWRVAVRPNDSAAAAVSVELVQPDCTVALELVYVQLTRSDPTHDRFWEGRTMDAVFSTWEHPPPDAVCATSPVSVSHATLKTSQHIYLPRGCLTVVVKMRAAKRPWSMRQMCAVTERACALADEQSLLSQLAQVRGSGAHADVSVRFSGAHSAEPAVPAHAFLLALRCPAYFGPLLHGPLRAAGPPFTCTVPEEVTPAALAVLLDYVYTDDLDGVLSLTAEVARAALWAADFFGLPRLLQLCAHRAEATLAADNALRTLELAHSHGCSALRGAALRCAAAHAPALMRTPEWAELQAPLRDAITLTLCNAGEPPADIAAPAARPRPAAEPEAGGTKRARH